MKMYKKNGAAYAILLILVAALVPPMSYAADADKPAEAIALTPRVARHGQILPPGDTDWYKFNATKGSGFTIRTYNMSMVMDSILTLYDVDTRTILAQNDDVEGGQELLASRIDFTFQRNGTYYVTVQHWDTELGTGTYSIILIPLPPPTIVLALEDRITAQPVERALVEIYNTTTYRLLARDRTTSSGTVSIEVGKLGYYLIVIKASGYHDVAGVMRVSTVGESQASARMSRVAYTGTALSSAHFTSPITPGVANTLRLSLQNMNSSYPIVLEALKIQFPWFGFYEGEWQGNLTVTQGMPATVQPKGIWRFDYKFTPPADTRGFSAISENVSHVGFQLEAKAWRLSVSVNNKTGLVVNQTLVVTKVDSALQPGQGFRAPIKGVVRMPTIDPTANSLLDAVSKKLDEVSTTLGKVSQGLDNSVSRLDDLTAGVRGSNQKLDEVSSQLGRVSSATTLTNRKLDDITAQLGTSNQKLDGLRGGVETLSSKASDTNTKLNSALTKLDDVLSSLTEGNSMLTGVNNKLEATGSRVNELSTLLLTNTLGMLILVAAIVVLLMLNMFYLRRIAKQLPGKAST